MSFACDVLPPATATTAAAAASVPGVDDDSTLQARPLDDRSVEDRRPRPGW